jgi:DNA adenine methylase
MSISIKPEPFLKWAGGKGKLLSQYSLFFPQMYNNYHEPFLGGGAVFFYLSPEKLCYLSDNNQELINAYLAVRDHANELIGLLKQLEVEYFSLPVTLRKELYLRIRSEKAMQDPITRAVYTLFLNKTCYNGLYRVNRRGQFNVPFGRYLHPAICDEHRLREVSKILQNKSINARDFRTVLLYANDKDFVYFDPPYHPLNSTAYFTSYTESGYNEQDQKDLAFVARELVKKGCFVMVSNSDTQFIRELYGEFRLIEMKARRNINCRPERRGMINELLILGY